MAKDKTAKIDIIPPKKGAFMIETAPDFFKLHTLCIQQSTHLGAHSESEAESSGFRGGA